MYTYLLTHVSMCVQTHMGTVQWMRASVTKSLGMCCFKPHHYTWLGGGSCTMNLFMWWLLQCSPWITVVPTGVYTFAACILSVISFSEALLACGWWSYVDGVKLQCLTHYSHLLYLTRHTHTPSLFHLSTFLCCLSLTPSPLVQPSEMAPSYYPRLIPLFFPCLKLLPSLMNNSCAYRSLYICSMHPVCN